MAKRGTLTHRKTRRLARLLGIDEATALGYLEALWHVTAERRPQGDIGALSDDDLIEEMYIRTPDAKRIVLALEEAGWLDKHPACRYVVHDWETHCDQATRRKLDRWKLPFIAPASASQTGDMTSQNSDLTSHQKAPLPAVAAVSVTSQTIAAASHVQSKRTFDESRLVMASQIEVPHAHAGPEPEPEPEPEPIVREPDSKSPPTSAKGAHGEGVDDWSQETPIEQATRLILDAYPKGAKPQLIAQVIVQEAGPGARDLPTLQANTLAWCSHWAKDPRFTPALHRWLLEGGWRKPPPLPPKSEFDQALEAWLAEDEPETKEAGK